MNTVSQFARVWFDWTIAASWQLALLIGLIAALVYALRDASPRLRYGLWLLVLLKALLPPTLGAFWAVGAWGVAPVVNFSLPNGSTGTNDLPLVREQREAIDNSAAATEVLAIRNTANGEGLSAIFLTESPLLLIWAAGCLSLLSVVAWRYWWITRMTDSMRRIEEGPASVELQRLVDLFSVRRTPNLYTTEQAISPMLFGVLTPKIVLPQPILDRLNPQELRMVLAHELVHWRRRDTWVGWLQVVVQCVYWFHPLVWLANTRIRHERECACDETVLREMNCDRDGYGESIVQVLTAARGRSLVVANMVGVFERGSLLQTRLEEIMRFDPTKRRFGLLSRVALIAVAVVLLPMAVPRVQADSAKNSSPAAIAVAEQKGADKADKGKTDKAAKRRPKTNWPTIVSTTPEIGATGVDPKIDEISITFDRDMDVTGYSWTGGGEFYPTSPKDEKPVWSDRRTCVLPVQLKKGSYYRVGINSTSFQNFRSQLGVPAPTSAIYFVTAGAKTGVMQRVRTPQVAKFSPENDSKDVDPGVKALRVKFDMPMDTGSYSWTGGGPTFPTIPEGKKPRWSRDGKTCMLPVKLKPGARYELGLNSLNHKNFTSKWGVPLEPVRYEFWTAGEPIAAPRIMKMVPENGTTDVSPALTKIQVIFDQPMAGGFSWTGGGEQFPTIQEGKNPSWSDDRKTCTLPVKLKPNWKYRFGLNSRSFKNFASVDGIPLEPVVYEFQTSPANE